MFSRNSCRGLTTCIPPIVRPRNIGCGWPLGVTILAIVKAVFGVGWNTERRTKAIALYIGGRFKTQNVLLCGYGARQYGGKKGCSEADGYAPCQRPLD